MLKHRYAFDYLWEYKGRTIPPFLFIPFISQINLRKEGSLKFLVYLGNNYLLDTKRSKQHCCFIESPKKTCFLIGYNKKLRP